MNFVGKRNLSKERGADGAARRTVVGEDNGVRAQPFRIIVCNFLTLKFGNPPRRFGFCGTALSYQAPALGLRARPILIQNMRLILYCPFLPIFCLFTVHSCLFCRLFSQCNFVQIITVNFSMKKTPLSERLFTFSYTTISAELPRFLFVIQFP